MKQYDLKFTAPNGTASECHVEIYPPTGLTVVTDIGQGMSVTNACEAIANEIVARGWVDAQKLAFVERYYSGLPEQTTDWVRFDFANGKAFRAPQWTHIPKEDFEKIVSNIEEALE